MAGLRPGHPTFARAMMRACPLILLPLLLASCVQEEPVPDDLKTVLACAYEVISAKPQARDVKAYIARTRDRKTSAEKIHPVIAYAYSSELSTGMSSIGLTRGENGRFLMREESWSLDLVAPGTAGELASQCKVDRNPDELSISTDEPISETRISPEALRSGAF